MIHSLFYETVFATWPEYRPSLEDLALDREAQLRDPSAVARSEIRLGQVWESRDERIRVLEIRTPAGGGAGGHFDVLVEFVGEEGFPFWIEADRIRMYWSLVYGEQQLELWS